jgi:hypothetical protein
VVIYDIKRKNKNIFVANGKLWSNLVLKPRPQSGIKTMLRWLSENYFLFFAFVPSTVYRQRGTVTFPISLATIKV